MKWISLILALLLAGPTLAYNFLTKKRLSLANGEETSYFQDRLGGDKVYFRRWRGDGVGGSFTLVELKGVRRTQTQLHQIEIEKDKLVVLESQGKFYFENYELGFNPLAEKIVRILSAPTQIWMTLQNVFYLSGERFLRLEQVDAKNFKPLQGLPYYFQDDKNAFFFKKGSFIALKLTSGEPLKALERNGYVSNGSQVFFEGQFVREINMEKIKLLSPESLTDYYLADDKKVFYRGQEVVGAEPNSFQFFAHLEEFDTSLFRDTRHVYFRGQKVPGVRPLEAQAIKSSQGRWLVKDTQGGTWDVIY